MKPSTEETYLGDGLYASFNGFMIWLRAPRRSTIMSVRLPPRPRQSRPGWPACRTSRSRSLKRADSTHHTGFSIARRLRFCSFLVIDAPDGNWRAGI